MLWCAVLVALPDANPSAPEALTALAAKGYRPMYVTARPGWLVQRTRDFIAARGLPEGIIHTTLSSAFHFDDPSKVAFKSAEVDLLTEKGLRPTYLIGNTDTDAESYNTVPDIDAAHLLYYQFTDSVHAGTRFDDYATLVAQFGDLPQATCP